MINYFKFHIYLSHGKIKDTKTDKKIIFQLSDLRHSDQKGKKQYQIGRRLCFKHNIRI